MSKDRNKDPNPDFKDQIENSHRAQLRSLARYVIQSLNLNLDERITRQYPTPEELIIFVIAGLELDKFYTPIIEKKLKDSLPPPIEDTEELISALTTPNPKLIDYLSKFGLTLPSNLEEILNLHSDLLSRLFDNDKQKNISSKQRNIQDHPINPAIEIEIRNRVFQQLLNTEAPDWFPTEVASDIDVDLNVTMMESFNLISTSFWEIFPGLGNIFAADFSNWLEQFSILAGLGWAKYIRERQGSELLKQNKSYNSVSYNVGLPYHLHERYRIDNYEQEKEQINQLIDEIFTGAQKFTPRIDIIKRNLHDLVDARGGIVDKTDEPCFVVEVARRTPKPPMPNMLGFHHEDKDIETMGSEDFFDIYPVIMYLPEANQLLSRIFLSSRPLVTHALVTTIEQSQRDAFKRLQVAIRKLRESSSLE